MTTRWKLRQDQMIARRSDGLVVVLVGSLFHVMRPTAGAQADVQVLAAGSRPSLAHAVDQADVLHPPLGWRFDQGAWVHAAWRVEPRLGAWVVTTVSGETLPTAPHPFAFIAQAWCEVRLDRSGRNLRGPLPKAPVMRTSGT